MSTLMVSGSGIRGVVGDTFTPSVILKYVSAFGHLQSLKHSTSDDHRRTIIIGRDSRISGTWVENIVQGILISQGYHVLLLGIVPTPTVQLMVILKKAVGGVIITCSHNPVEWNGLKFVNSEGLFLLPDDCKKMFEIADNPSTIKYSNWDSFGSLDVYDHAIDDHINKIFELPYFNKEIIQKKNFKICLDTINGAGGVILSKLLKELNVDLIHLNSEQNGIFAHKPEPIPENLNDLCKSVKENGADLGIAVDPDVDRCVLIDENGIPLGEEYTLAIAVDFILGRCNKKSSVVKNLSSSRAIDEIAKKYGCESFSTPVGELHVAKKMIEVNSAIGGEGNGGVMLTDVHIGRDAPVAVALILLELAHFNGTLSEKKKTLPQWSIVKLTLPVSDVDIDKALDIIKNEWRGKGATIIEDDGLKIEDSEFWVHLRKSNTEPIIRVIGESITIEKATSICQDFMNQIKEVGKK